MSYEKYMEEEIRRFHAGRALSRNPHDIPFFMYARPYWCDDCKEYFAKSTGWFETCAACKMMTAVVEGARI